MLPHSPAAGAALPLSRRQLGGAGQPAHIHLYRQRCSTAAAIARLLGQMAAQRTGNYLFFFPSYAYMLMVAGALGEAYPQVETLVQTPGMTEAQRDSFLARFVAQPAATLVGFAVMGGVFGEGIDLAGEQLCGAAVIGVGLPAISPENELIRDFFATHNGAGFEYAYLYPGFNRVLQAVGRVIRSESDRGAVLLVDTRFATRRYRRLFPREWCNVRTAHGALEVRRAIEGFVDSGPPTDV